jgi:hypothetical protein
MLREQPQRKFKMRSTANSARNLSNHQLHLPSPLVYPFVLFKNAERHLAVQKGLGLICIEEDLIETQDVYIADTFDIDRRSPGFCAKSDISYRLIGY